MSIQLSKSEYLLLIKSIENVSDKIDKIFDKISHMDKKTVALEEWRKHHDMMTASYIADIAAIKKDSIDNSYKLKKRISTLENFRWFLVGISAAISTLFSIVIKIVLYGVPG